MEKDKKRIDSCQKIVICEKRRIGKILIESIN